MRDTLMNPENGVMTLEQALGKVRGQKLTSVQFVHDYVQFGFEAAGLSAYSHPVIRVAGHDLDWLSPLFRHELCLRIGKPVVDTWVDEKSVSIGFEDGALLVVPIEPDGPSPESLEFGLEGNETTWVA
ncbi:MAG: hypothetical protein Kow001_00290 [Acidobacteriota bacterium]